MKNPNTPPKAVTIGRETFPSIKKAAAALKISRTRISSQIKLREATLKKKSKNPTQQEFEDCRIFRASQLKRTFSPRRHEKIAAHKKNEDKPKTNLKKNVKGIQKKV